MIKTQKREHSRKLDALYAIIEACSPGLFLELCARGQRADRDQWGNKVVDYAPSWPMYANHRQH
jgi:N6-adenosine-specific RNA methylase IME4